MDELDSEDLVILPENETYKDKLPRGYLSVSQVNQYMKCGKAYEFRYVDGIVVPGNSFTAQGSALHKGAEVMHTHMMRGDTPHVDLIEAAYVDAHTEFFAPEKEILIMEEDIDAGKVKDLGVQMIRHYHAGASGQLKDPDTGVPLRKVYPVAVERIVRTMLKPLEGEEVPFLMVIDLEEPTAVRDLKTKRKLGPQSETDNSLQLSLYAYGTGKPDVSLDQLIKPTKKLGTRYVRREATRTPEEMQHAVEIAAGVATDVAAGRFRLAPPDAWWCTADWCHYWGRCRGRKR
jgi:hypothetical protein